jgi:hypothetical protein
VLFDQVENPLRANHTSVRELPRGRSSQTCSAEPRIHPPP